MEKKADLFAHSSCQSDWSVFIFELVFPPRPWLAHSFFSWSVLSSEHYLSRENRCAPELEQFMESILIWLKNGEYHLLGPDPVMYNPLFALSRIDLDSGFNFFLSFSALHPVITELEVLLVSFIDQERIFCDRRTLYQRPWSSSRFCINYRPSLYSLVQILRSRSRHTQGWEGDHNSRSMSQVRLPPLSLSLSPSAYNQWAQSNS